MPAASLSQQTQSYNISTATSFSCPTITPASGDTLIAICSASNSSAFRLNGTTAFSISDGTNSYKFLGMSPGIGTLTFSSSAYPNGYIPAGSTALTLASAWAGTTGHYGVLFSDNELLSCYLANGATGTSPDNGYALANNVGLTAAYYGGGYEGIVYIAQNVAGVPTVVSAASSTAFYGMWVGDAVGVAQTGGAYGFITNNQNTAGAQVNTGTMSISQSVLLVGFAFYYTGSISGNTPSAAGAGFTGLANVWSNGAENTAMAEYANVSGNTAATWTPQTVNAQSFVSFGIALSTAQSALSPIMGRRVYVLP
jgi:hypothetical protein